ncbi:EamA family transporter [Halotalea alkalilenta]|uniref:EamA domain-containing protein n=1 Tax=Halotalea alkalilenta TaxID=376489 RepID=A0A172YE08_9GAMM|nr:EamA family transporter [Halotalea alkalilenta]ANF57488.1 hypothetical protein A5892_08430 [Halotalea alkalilenta]
MTTPVLLAVLLAAALHAGWNALVKVGLDRLLAITLIQVASMLAALALLPFAGLPPKVAWPWLEFSAVLHVGYNLALVRAYRYGDLGQVYPIARGTSPLLVALVSMSLFDAELDAPTLAGIALLVAGIWLMALRGGGGLRLRGETLAWALTTSVFIAAYTLADGYGARAAGDALVYVCWLFLLDGLGMLLVTLALRGPGMFGAFKPYWAAGLGGGAMSLAAYGIAIWAMTQAPVALVSALRETSVLFALLIATLWLKEPLPPGRLLAGAVIVAGVIVTRLG